MERNCAACAEPIDAKRLQARPKTRLCIECQKASEKRGDFALSRMEIGQEIEGWSYVGQKENLIKGDE